MCLLVPCLIALFVWWMPDVSNMFCKKCQCKDDDKEIGANQDIERLIATVLVTGIQKFIVNHPKTTETLSDILKTFIKTKGKKRLTK